MASDTSRTNQRVIVIPEQSINIDINNSTFTEASPKAGTPMPSAVTQLALTATGPLTENLNVQVVDPGFPVNTSSSLTSGSRSIWKPASGAGDSWRGYDAPRAVSAWTDVFYNDATITSILHIDSTRTVLSDTVMAVYQVTDTGIHPGSFNNRIEVSVQDSETGAFSRVLIESEEFTPAQDYCPCIVTLPSGRVQVYRILPDGYLRMWYSDDAGTTWAHGGDGVIGQALGNVGSLTRMRVAYNSGQLVLMVLDESGAQNLVEVFVSSDLGNTFVNTETLTPKATFDTGYFDIEGAPAGGFVLVIHGWQGGDDRYIDAYTVPDGYSSWLANSRTSRALIGTVGFIATRKSDITLVLDDNLVLRAYHTFFDTGTLSDSVTGKYSNNSGKTWGGYVFAFTNEDEIVTYSTTQSNVGLSELSATYQRGRIVMFHKWLNGTIASGGAAGSSYPAGAGMGALYLGGYTTISMPSATTKKSDASTYGWAKAWFPTEVPTTDTNWITTGTGTKAILGPPANLNLTSSVATTMYFSDVASTTETAMAAKFVVSPKVGDRTTLETAVRCAVVAPAVGNLFSASIRLASNGFSVWDEGGTPTRISDFVTLSISADPVEVWIELDDTGYCTVQYRMWSTSEDREWTKVFLTGAALAQLTSFAATRPTVEWGHLVVKASPGTTFSYWKQMLFANTAARTSAGITTTLAGGQNNPEDLRGKSMAGTPFLGRGAYTSSRRGPAWRGEFWDVSTDADYALRNSVSNPSPRIGWRSTDLSPQTLTFSIDSTPTYGPRKVLAVMLRDTNIAEYELFGFDGSSYVSLGTVSNKLDSLSFTRNGSSVIPGSETTPPYLKHGEFIGGEFAFSPGTVSRKIVSHSEGVWDSGHALRPVLRLDGVEGSDAASGFAGAIVPDQCITLVELTTDYSRFRLVIPSSTTHTPADPFFKIGSLVIGWCYPLGADYAWGRTLVTEAPVDVIQTRDMQKRVKKLSPTIRKVAIAWTDGIDQTAVEADDADPNYVKIGTEAGAADVGTAYALEGMFREMHGEAGSLIYMPHVPALTSMTTFSRKRDALHGRFTMGDFTVNTVQGEEHETEVVRVSTVTITEDV